MLRRKQVNQNLTEFYFVIDATGSMRLKYDEVISGFNNFIADQAKQPGEAVLTVMVFESGRGCQVLAKRVPLDSFQLTRSNYRLGSMTPLYEACSKGIELLGGELACQRESDRPGKVVFVIMTDGLENASRHEFTKERLNREIRHQTEKYGWNFIFLGQDIDAEVEGAKAGVNKGTTASVGSFERGLGVTSEKVKNYRATGNAERLIYTDADKGAMN